VNERRRKLIHIASALAPLTVWVLPRGTALVILGGLLATAAVVEVARRRVPWIRERFLAFTGEMLRPHERHRVTGATYMAVAYFLAALLFQRPVAVAAMLYNAFGDAAAAFVGRAWGRNRASWGKSYEGLLAGFLVNGSIGLIVPGIGTTAAVIGAAGAALLEFLPLPIDDNLSLTLGGGALLWLASLA
jgi:dolichol kinase